MINQEHQLNTCVIMRDHECSWVLEYQKPGQDLAWLGYCANSQHGHWRLQEKQPSIELNIMHVHACKIITCVLKMKEISEFRSSTAPSRDVGTAFMHGKY